MTREPEKKASESVRTIPGKTVLPAIRGVKEYLIVALPSAATTADASAGSAWAAGGRMSRTRIVIPGSGLQEKPVVTVVVPPCCRTFLSDERVILADVTTLCILSLNLMASSAERSTSEKLAKKKGGSPSTIPAAPRKAAITQMP
jgi:hypothetical protein